jgi:hypothetical protein
MAEAFNQELDTVGQVCFLELMAAVRKVFVEISLHFD